MAQCPSLPVEQLRRLRRGFGCKRIPSHAVPQYLINLVDGAVYLTV